MTLEVFPKLGVEIPKDVPYQDLRDRALALCETVRTLHEEGLSIGDVDDIEKDAAAALLNAYAEDPSKASKSFSNTDLASLSPQSVLLVGALLDQYGKAILDDSLKLRHYITNRLVIESNNDDPKNRLRALEMLGKISDVGLFTEKREVTHVHKTQEELRESLRSKLAAKMAEVEAAGEIQDAEYEVITEGGDELHDPSDKVDTDQDLEPMDDVLPNVEVEEGTEAEWDD